MKNNFKIKLYDLLKKDSRLWDEEKKELNETLLKDLIDKLDEKLIELLLSDKETEEMFFIKAKDVFIFKQNELKFFIDGNKIDNSYTQYQNKIGLRVGNKLLSERNEVVLDWPFKDCVLEGGMTKEDQKRNEIFFNEVLAKDEIDRLFDPKAFVNWKRYTAKGEEKVKELKRDKDGLIRENLVIKGNNLLALHSLKGQFIGKVKFIYIDPIYNEDGTVFYNDNFRHSSWLTFMKNRLEVSKNLLKNNGVIFIQIGDGEYAYLKVLADAVFLRDNFISTISRVAKTASNKGTYFAPSVDYILCYAKDKTQLPEFYDKVDESLYKKVEKSGPRKGDKYRDDVALYQSSLDPMRGCTNQRYFIECPDGSLVIPPGNNFPSSKKEGEKISPETENDKVWRWTVDTHFKNKDILVFKETKTSPLLDENGHKAKWNIYTKSYLKDRQESGTKPRNYLDQFINRKGADYIKKLNIDFDYSKPVELIKYLIDIVGTEKDDIILDFFAGSATTAEAVIRVNKDDGGKRQFIIFEQMNYMKTATMPRVKKIIGDEDFVYFELARWNEEAKEKILKAKNLTELEKLFDELYERYFLNYNVKTKKFKEKILKEEGFKKLSLDEQKNLFVEMLDMNQMYVNFSERADKKYNLSEKDIKLSEEFYLAK